VAVVAAGSAALLARPWLVRLPGDPVPLLVALFVVLGIVGATWRLPAPPTEGGGRPPVSAWVALGLGLGAFGVGRLLAAGTVPVAPFVLRSVALNSLAAVSEEAFFRRFAYGLAAVRGPALAVATSAAIFAAVHVTVWGWGVLPLDLAAGLVLGWQRWASGGWSVPAATHVAANVLAVF
jgi:membrane protease YdiL (CAAX protease family)